MKIKKIVIAPTLVHEKEYVANASNIIGVAGNYLPVISIKNMKRLTTGR